ncbi:MAG: L,D-transpeptidase family protein [Desulfosarcinaceae bacterium]|nr:L,D-transpeptidase family protein [Desulfosarcinaceae bacterium]
MSRNARYLLIPLLLQICAIGAPTGAQTFNPSTIQLEIERQLHAEADCRPQGHAAVTRLESFYAGRDHASAWLDADGLKPSALALVAALRDAAQEGLDPIDYPLSALERAMAELLYQAGTAEEISPAKAAAFDVALSRTALRFGRHLAVGRVTPQATGQSWFGPVNRDAWQPRLDRMLRAESAGNLMAAAAPPHRDYGHLRRALVRYRQLAAEGGWTPIASERTLEEGMTAEAVRRLRVRLEMSGDLMPEINRIAANSMTSNRFDAALTRAVVAFQTRHGLKPDGKVGKVTLAALNVPVQNRIDTLRANLERQRWIPINLGARLLRVNIPAFQLEALSDGQVVQSMRVVVGRPKRPTPVLSGKITYLELNPYWHIPPRIARKDLLPKIQADPAYLLQQGIRVFSDWTAQARELDPQEIDWARLTVHRFPFKLRQDPVASNALGRVKFMFPNKHSIYLHDTPAKGLFAKQRRSFSSGCVRVAEPEVLTALLLSDRPAWSRDRIGEAFAGRKPKVVRLRTPMPVHLQYWTAWVDATDRVHFREDIYGRDHALLRSLSQRHLQLATCPSDPNPEAISSATAATRAPDAAALHSS